ncbi:PTS galactitol transporter subunit IIA [Pasteurellaceae bacterium LIM206]|nr:PTS galactitol transporter subunit IIA [Pasteurellaceae bacterium LIM206]
MNPEILLKTNIEFDDFTDVLNYLADNLIAQGFVKETYREAVFAREKDFPTGIELEFHAVAIPHCGAEHAVKPALYFIRPNKKVAFNRADEDTTIDVELIIGLVVTDPNDQLKVLRALFGKLQQNDFIEKLLSVVDENQLRELINQHIQF